MTLVEAPRISDAQLADGQAFLRTLSLDALSAMLDTLLPGVRAGEAGPGIWAAITAIRAELEEREADL